MTNSIRTLFLAAAAMLLCTAPIRAAELAINGGFETGDFTASDASFKTYEELDASSSF